MGASSPGILCYNSRDRNETAYGSVSSTAVDLTAITKGARNVANDDYTFPASDGNNTFQSSEQNDTAPLQGASLDTARFLDTLYRDVPDGVLEITLIAPKDASLHPHIRVFWADFPLRLDSRHYARLHQMNQAGYGIYFGTAVRQTRKDFGRGTQKDARYITCLWCDVDDISPEAGWSKLVSMPVMPSLIVHSGGGVHGYWLLNSPLGVTEDNLHDIRRALHGIAVCAGSNADTKVRDLARVMRLPGFLNTKRGVACEVIEALPDVDMIAYYHYHEIAPIFARYAPQNQPPVFRHVPVQAGQGMPKWVEQYLETGVSEGDRNNRAYAAARELLDNGFSISEVERLVGGRAAADGLPEGEIKVILNSAATSPRNVPNMPHHISGRMAAADHLTRKRGR